MSSSTSRRRHQEGDEHRSPSPTSDSILNMSASATAPEEKNESIIVKVGMVGDSGVGKTSLMVRFVEKRFDADYVETLGVNFMEKTLSLPQAEVTLSLWDLGGERSFLQMLPMVCVDAVAVLFMFDLNQVPTLASIREWYRQVRGLNREALPFLVGCKFDTFVAENTPEQQLAITEQARKFAKAMHAPLVFCSASAGVNVQSLFKLVFERVFGLEPSVKQRSNVGEPILEYT